MTMLLKKCEKVTTSNFQSFLSTFDAVIFDCDGVLWIQSKPIKGAIEVISLLKKYNKKVFYFTNNNTNTREEYLNKLLNLGFDAELSEVYSSSYIAACHIKEKELNDLVYIIGSDGLSKELHCKGIKHFGNGPDPLTENIDEFLNHEQLNEKVKAVLVGFDSHLSYPKIIKAANYLKNENCLFLATNTDEQLPILNPSLVFPGTGCMVRIVEAACNRKATILGKPNPQLFTYIQKDHTLTANKTLMVGDRCNTDIEFGNECGMITLLVLSGVTTLSELNKYIQESQTKWVPDYYLNSIGDLSKLFFHIN